MQKESAYNLKFNLRSKMRSDEKPTISTKVENSPSVDPSKQKEEKNVDSMASNSNSAEIDNVK